jgi:nucleoside-triphosphatase THEP1
MVGACGILFFFRSSRRKTIMLVIVRGLPGSGKTKLVEQLAKELYIPIHYKPDIFYKEHNITVITPEKVKEANAWCIAETYNTLKSGLGCIVSNVFATKKDIGPYVNMCRYFNKEHTIMVVAKNHNDTGGIPLDIYRQMENSWESF